MIGIESGPKSLSNFLGRQTLWSHTTDEYGIKHKDETLDGELKIN